MRSAFAFQHHIKPQTKLGSPQSQVVKTKNLSTPIVSTKNINLGSNNLLSSYKQNSSLGFKDYTRPAPSVSGVSSQVDKR